uniref:C-type lectin domain-containing protein n=1 Tax=Globodera pallida TaxID=36090 RepID=A0A183C3B6_GLOPA
MVFTFYGSYGKGFADSKGAKTRCEALDANLASIHGPKENQHVNALIRKSYEQCRQDGVPWCCDTYVHDGYWIGMTLARADNGTILSAEWSDGTRINYGHPLKTADQVPWYTPEHQPVQEVKSSNNDYGAPWQQKKASVVVVPTDSSRPNAATAGTEFK